MKKILAFCTVLLIFNSAFASNYYWVNGSGKWSDHSNHWATTSGGGVFHIDVPSPSDDVFFDANSFSSPGDTVIVDSTVVNCHSLIWSDTSATHVDFPNFYGIDIYGSLKLSSNLIWGGSAVTFKSSGQDSVDFAGVSMSGHLDFDGTGHWKLLSDIDYTSGQIYFSNGTFNSNNYNIEASNIYSTGDTIFFGTSVITCDVWFSTGNYGTIYSDLTTVIAGTFRSGINQHYKKVVSIYTFELMHNSQCDSVITVDATLDHDCYIKYLEMQSPYLTHLEGSTASSVDKIKITAPSAEVFGTLIVDSLIFADSMYIDVSGASITVNRFLGLKGLCRKWAFLNGATSTGNIVVNAGSVNLYYVRFKNISASGTGTIQAFNSVDEGNVSGINIHSPSPRKFFWVNGTGKWNDPNQWSSVSGGAGETCIPSKYDSVFFDSNSFSGLTDTVYANSQIACKYMSWNTANNPVFFNNNLASNEVRIYGSLLLCTTMKWKIGSVVYFSPDTLNTHINTCGKLFLNNVYFDGTGEAILDDSLSVPTTGYGTLFIKGGILRTSGKSIHATKIDLELVNTGSFTPGIYLDTSFIKCSQWEATGFPVFGMQSAIVCSTFNDQTTNQYGNVNCVQIWNVHSSFIDVSASIIYGGGTFHHLVITEHPQGQVSFLSGPVVIQKLTFNAPSTTISLTVITDTLETTYRNLWLKFDSVKVNHFLNLNGGCNSIINIEGGKFSLFGTYDIISTTMQNVKFIGPAVNAMNSIDNGGNAGINFTGPPARQLYWVNGTGTWDDINHWSATSGGPGGSCIPSLVDDIYFDSNSFNTSHDTVQVRSPFIFAHSMTWTDSSYIKDNFIFGAPVFFLHGSFSLCPGLSWIFDKMKTKVHSDNPVNNIDGYGAFIDAEIYIIDSTSWHLQSEFVTHSYLEANNLWTHGNHLRFNTALLRNCFLDSSTVTCDDQLNGYDLHGDSASIIGAYGNAALYNSTIKFIDLDYLGMKNSTATEIMCNDIDVDSTILPMVTMKAGNFNNLYFHNNGLIRKCDVYGSEVRLYWKENFDTLRFLTLGQIINVWGRLTVSKKLIISSNGAFPATLQSLNRDTIVMTQGIQCFDFLYIKNIVATGGAHFYAGASSVDQGGNSGWMFVACILTSVEDYAQIKFNIYPNPALDNFYIEREGNEQYLIELINLNGQIVREFASNESIIEVNISGLAKGMYALRIRKLNEVAFRKIVIE